MARLNDMKIKDGIQINKSLERHSGDYIVGERGPEKLHMDPGSTGHVTPMEHRAFGGPVLGAIGPALSGPLGGPAIGPSGGGYTGTAPSQVNDIGPGPMPNRFGEMGRFGLGGDTGVGFRAKGGEVHGKSKFQKMVGKLEKKGNSAESATKIAAAIGRKKYGAEGMAKKAAASRRRNGR